MRGTDIPQLPARYYARLLELLEGQGVDGARLLRAARLRPQALQAPDALLRLSEVEALLAAALRETGRSDLGFALGRALRLGSHSVVGFAILSSPDLDYALRLVARYFRLITPTFRLRYRAGERVELAFEPVLPLSPLALAFHIETLAVATHGELRDLLQRALPHCELYLSIPEPPHVARYAELADARCHFGAGATPGVRLVLPGRAAQLPLALADAATLRMAEARCQALVRSAVAGGRVSEWVRMMLRESRDGMPGLEELAHTLNLSPRTLDRYLRREGTGFRPLVLAARHDKARALLAQGLSVTQVAHELGYSDAANFTRAFRRESGRSPSAYRAQRRPRRH